MKNKYRYMAILAGLAVLMALSKNLYAQDNNTSGVKQQIQNKQFTFIATSVSPMKGSTRFLNELYDVRITRDSVIAYLPYFGESQSAPISSDDAGIKFTSTKFGYVIEREKKNSWSIQISFNDQQSTRQFNFSIFDNGSATLDVNSSFRDPISFSGHLKGL